MLLSGGPEHGNNRDVNALGSQIVREIILPALEKEVNEGKNFAMLRQVYSGMILAAWYKRALKESLLGQVYADKAKVNGVDQDPKANEAIYQQYLKAFKKGVYNYIKEDTDKYTHQTIPRKYFSGGAVSFNDPTHGVDFAQVVQRVSVVNPAQSAQIADEAMATDVVKAVLTESKATDSAMIGLYKDESEISEELRDQVMKVANKSASEVSSIVAQLKSRALEIAGSGSRFTVTYVPEEKYSDYSKFPVPRKPRTIVIPERFHVVAADAAMTVVPLLDLKKSYEPLQHISLPRFFKNLDGPDVPGRLDLDVVENEQGELVTRLQWVINSDNSVRRIVLLPGRHFDQDPMKVVRDFGLNKQTKRHLWLHLNPGATEQSFKSVFDSLTGRTRHALFQRGEREPAWVFTDTRIGNTAEDSFEAIDQRRKADVAMTADKAMIVSDDDVETVLGTYKSSTEPIISFVIGGHSYEVIGLTYERGQTFALFVKRYGVGKDKLVEAFVPSGEFDGIQQALTVEEIKASLEKVLLSHARNREDMLGKFFLSVINGTFEFSGQIKTVVYIRNQMKSIQPAEEAWPKSIEELDISGALYNLLKLNHITTLKEMYDWLKSGDVWGVSVTRLTEAWKVFQKMADNNLTIGQQPPVPKAEDTAMTVEKLKKAISAAVVAVSMLNPVGVQAQPARGKQAPRQLKPLRRKSNTQATNQHQNMKFVDGFEVKLNERFYLDKLDPLTLAPIARVMVIVKSIQISPQGYVIILNEVAPGSPTIRLSGPANGAHPKNLIKIPSKDKDRAQIGNPLGGIDMNAANLNLQIKRDGRGVPLPLPQQDLEHIKIDGLVPVILEIKPAVATPLLSELQVAGAQQAKI